MTYNQAHLSPTTPAPRRETRSSSAWSWAALLSSRVSLPLPLPLPLPLVDQPVDRTAVTAGIILFFHFHKRKQDRRNKHDQQLLPLHIPPAYKATSAEYPIIPSPARPPQPYTHAGRRGPDHPPAYQAALPVYDPSKYQNLNWPISTSELNRQSIGPGPSLLNPVHYPGARRSFHPVDNRLTIQRLSGATSVELARRQFGMSSFRGDSSLEWSRPSNESTLGSNGELSRSLSQSGELSPRRPRRPKPVLSRLITNFG